MYLNALHLFMFISPFVAFVRKTNKLQTQLKPLENIPPIETALKLTAVTLQIQHVSSVSKLHQNVICHKWQPSSIFGIIGVYILAVSRSRQANGSAKPPANPRLAAPRVLVACLQHSLACDLNDGEVADLYKWGGRQVMLIFRELLSN